MSAAPLATAPARACPITALQSAVIRRRDVIAVIDRLAIGPSLHET